MQIAEAASGRDSLGGARLEDRLVELARRGGPTRRVLAALAGRLVEMAGFERLGYARLSDYARERLGLSARTLQDLARVDAKLAGLPELERALVEGALSWSRVRLLARFATARDEAFWIDYARCRSVRVLERELRAVGRGQTGSVETNEASGTATLTVAPRVAFKWRRTCRDAARVAGETTPDGTVLEWVTAEVLAGLPVRALDATFAVPGVAMTEIEAESGEPAAEPANVCGPQGVPEAPPPVAGHAELPVFAAALVRDLDELDAFELDARLRRAVRLEQRQEAEMAPLLRAARSTEYEWRGPGRTWGGFVREELGLSPRKARALVRLDRLGDVCSALREGFRSGHLSWVQAQELARLVIGGESEERALEKWVHWAPTVSARCLLETVEKALALRAIDPDGDWDHPERVLAADEKAVAQERERKRPTCARPTSFMDDIRLRIRAERSTLEGFAEVLSAVRRTLEQRDGRLPSEGEAFEAMLDEAIGSWAVRDPFLRRRVKREEAIFERDGWRCTVPGCSSRRNLQRHHIRFRSAGGGDESANQTTLCAFHHLRGVHAGRVRVVGRAPDALRFELGTRADGPPLATYASGDRVVV